MGMDISEKNACTTVETVIHVSPSAPPRLWRIAFCTIIIRLSDAIIINGEMPSFIILPITRMSGFANVRRILVPLSLKNITTNRNERNCESIVASAAPATSILKTKMKRGSSAMLATAPITVVVMPIPEYPCAVMYWLSPVAVIENNEPAAYIMRYCRA